MNLPVTNTICLWWRNPIQKAMTHVGGRVLVLVCLGRKFLSLDLLHYGNMLFHCYFSFSLCSPALSLELHQRLAVSHQKLSHISLIQMLLDPLLICNF
uniref:Uncharacterized protein n=1 Tax=Arundo donax TaxID=35708 RepID=A0A0A9ALY6_ARUDO